MSTNDIVVKAKKLKTEGRIGEVIELLENYVQENESDREALALYCICVARKFYLDNNLAAEQLFGDSTIKYQGMSAELALKTSAHFFRDMLAEDYLAEKTYDEKLNFAYAALRNEFEALGELIVSYESFKTQMDKFYSTIMSFEIRDSFYYMFSQFIDWESDLSNNVIQYIVDKVKPIACALMLSEEDIYNTYIQNMNPEKIPPKNTKPVAKADVNLVFSEEVKKFWVDYLELVAKTRENELVNYQEIESNKSHPLNPAFSAWVHVYSKLSDYKGSMSTDKYLEGFEIVRSIRISGDELKKEAQKARKLISTIKVMPGMKIINMVKQIVGKIKGFFNRKNN